MTRRDYEIIAKGIREAPLDDGRSLRLVAESMADTLATTNPRFDRERFILAATKGA